MNCAELPNEGSAKFMNLVGFVISYKGFVVLYSNIIKCLEEIKMHRIKI